MRDFFESSMFWAVLGGFAVMFLYQIVIRGSLDEDRDKRITEYMSRLNDDARARIDTTLAEKNRIEAIKIFRAETNVGLKEAKECIEYIRRENRR